jgi:hypothetical protein
MLNQVDFSSNLIEGYFKLKVNCLDPLNPCDIAQAIANPTPYHVLASNNRFYNNRGEIQINGIFGSLPDTEPYEGRVVAH